MAIGLELVSYIYVYNDEDYKDTAERVRNLGKRIQISKKNILYGEGVKRRKEEKMIKIQEENFRDYHR